MGNVGDNVTTSTTFREISATCRGKVQLSANESGNENSSNGKSSNPFTEETENREKEKGSKTWLGTIVSFMVWQGESQWDSENAFEKKNRGGVKTASILKKWSKNFPMYEIALKLKREEFEHGGVSDVTERYSTFLQLRFAQGLRGAEFGAWGHELKVIMD